MMDFVTRAAGCTVFSKIDLKNGCHQILMNPGDIPKTAITTLFGLFEFTRMTFGMRNAGNTFQRLMDRVLAGVECAFPYLDAELGTRSLFPGSLSALRSFHFHGSLSL